jgi:teichuronic acid biosynthesis glycosyltransferase TuaG
MKGPKFSIVIPCYNGKEFLRDCFSSVKEQTFKDYEVLFVDDNSHDGSFEYALDLKNEFDIPGQFFQKEKSIKTGVSSSRNLALKKASGSWIVFLDCDDYFEPNKLQLIHQYIEDHPQAFAIHHSYTKFGETIPDSLIKIQDDEPHDFDFLIRGNPIGTSTVAVSRKVIQDLGGFNTNLNGVEDYFLWCRMANKLGPWSYIPLPLTFYRYLSNSLMSQRKLTYYINQMCNFYKEARACGEFDEPQLEKIRRNLFYEQLNYQVKISLDNYGVVDFLGGLGLLIMRGEQKPAMHHLGIRFKNFLLFHISKIVKPKRLR